MIGAVGKLSGLLMLLTLVTPSSAVGADLHCKGSPRLIGKCYSVRGEVSLSADRGFVLGRDDTGRALVVQGDWPDNLNIAMGEAQRRTGFVSAWVHGTYEVCPIQPEEPENEYVCIQSATGLRPERAGERK